MIRKYQGAGAGVDVLSNLFVTLEPALMLFVWLTILLAAVLRAFTGFGFGLAAVPVFALFLPPTQAVVLSSALGFAISLITVRSYWGVYPVRPLLPMLVMALLGIVLGVLLLGFLDVRQFQLWLGIAVIATCLVLARYRPGRRDSGWALSGGTGLLSGILGGAFAIPGPPVIVYAMATQDDPVLSRSLLLTFFLFSAGLALLVYGAAGFFTTTTPWLFALGLPAILLGDRLGQILFHRFAARFYRRVALGVLMALGLGITLRAMF